MNSHTLPAPSPEAVVAAEALHSQILRMLAEQGGWISFAQYMEAVLYTPGLGYYSGGAAKLGQDGDFTTAPELTPLFGRTLAAAAGPIWPQIAPEVLEFGAGSGKLAFDFLSACAEAGHTVRRYAILELSGELRARQQARLRAFPQVEWLDTLPAAFSGLVLGNEVLDAMPVRLLRKIGAEWREVGVEQDEDGHLCLAAAAQPCSPGWVEQIVDAAHLSEGYQTEVHPAACAFMRSVAQMLARGHAETGQGSLAWWFDYGFPAAEYYLPERSAGTLVCHYRHRVHDDPFFWPGLQDITAHVDFTAMARAAQAGGAPVLGYTSQAAWLLAHGLLDQLARVSPDDPLHYLPMSNAVHKLVSPAEMGELFKVLCMGVGVQMAQPGGLRQRRLEG